MLEKKVINAIFQAIHNLKKTSERLEILEGLISALNNLKLESMTKLSLSTKPYFQLPKFLKYYHQILSTSAE